MLAALLNGVLVPEPARALSIEDRGLSYGDGVFETMLLRDGRVRFVEAHLARLSSGCERVGINPPRTGDCFSDIERLVGHSASGIVKLIVTRGAGGRGYRSNASIATTRIAMLYAPLAIEPRDIAVRWCSTRLARNSQLAGIKHLNRLEQVLAQTEWNDSSIAEGLMLDTEGEVVCATSSNLFVVNNGILTTPDLRFSGVDGVLRRQAILAAARLKIETKERSLWPDDVRKAEEVFLTNAVRGIRPVVALGKDVWPVGPVTRRLIDAIEADA